MEDKLKNRIEAKDTSINDLLKGKKFFIDYFQREYRWQKEQIIQLMEDLTETFLNNYNDGDEYHAVENYQNY
jgi:uncharacterized protein with ParB-like and HNH nuclease domain